MAKDSPATSDAKIEEQTPDQFITLGADDAEDEAVPANHATKGMVELGYTEASRITDSHIALSKEQRAFERKAAKE